MPANDSFTGSFFSAPASAGGVTLFLSRGKCTGRADKRGNPGWALDGLSGIRFDYLINIP